MNHDLESSDSIVINADLAKVWDVMTNPEKIKEYLFGTETITDWKVGSPVVFQGEYQGHKYRDYGVVKENILHKRIAYSYWSGFFGVDDKPENYSIVTISLNPAGNNQTTLTWSMKGFIDEARRTHSQNGMKAFLLQIKGIAER